jgi:hypothetical protein
VKQLEDIGRTRNSAAHIGGQGLAAIKAASYCVIAAERTRTLFAALKILLGGYSGRLRWLKLTMPSKEEMIKKFNR